MRSRPGWRLGLVAAVAASLGFTLLQPASGDAALPTGAPSDTAAADGAEGLGFAVQLGPEQRVIGPTDQGDNPYFSETRNGKLYGYFGTSRTVEWRSKANKRLSHPRVIIDRGLPGKFDDCGAWLNGSIQKYGRHWVAFYHSEGSTGGHGCDPYGKTNVDRMAIVESTNAGLTWRRPNYPNNVVLAGEGATASHGLSNANGGRVVRIGEYLYIFYRTRGERNGASGIHMARALASGFGRPGTWKKYYCTSPVIGTPVCSWNQDGIGGKSTPIGGLSEKSRFVIWNAALNRWIGLDASGKQGFRMFASQVGSGATDDARQYNALFDDHGFPMKWAGSEDVYPLVSTENDKYVDQWGGTVRNARSKQLYAYPSLGGLQGQSCCTGSSFYIYYVKLFPGDKFTKRYLFRREVKVIATDQALNRVELTTYKNRKGKRFSSTEAPKSKSYKRQGAVGYLLAHGEVAGWKQVFDCTRRGDHALYANKCKTGWKPYRRVGFVYPQKTTTASVAVYRCYAKKSHYASSSRGCDGGKREARLGFAMKGF
ncbi:hypothetical protein [Nocardioides sp. MH1]|uniref:hypothetical protein n=1 Tax=Nocardioides sp. MH1 TaxID=3242490 RepID=UPI003520A0F0